MFEIKIISGRQKLKSWPIKPNLYIKKIGWFSSLELEENHWTNFHKLYIKLKVLMRSTSSSSPIFEIWLLRATISPWIFPFPHKFNIANDLVWIIYLNYKLAVVINKAVILFKHSLPNSSKQTNLLKKLFFTFTYKCFEFILL